MYYIYYVLCIFMYFIQLCILENDYYKKMEMESSKNYNLKATSVC
jgi:hypothetical protein